MRVRTVFVAFTALFLAVVIFTSIGLPKLHQRPVYASSWLVAIESTLFRPNDGDESGQLLAGANAELARRYGQPDHASSENCFTAQAASVFPQNDASVTLSTCDDWIEDIGEYESSIECAHEPPSSPFGQYCQLSNVCYSNYTFYMFQTNPANEVPKLRIFPGVGRVQRNGVPFIRFKSVLGIEERENWFAEHQTCEIEKPSFVFARIYTNFFYTTYSAAALDVLLRQLDPEYPKVVPGDRIVLLADKSGVKETAEGFFEMFSPYRTMDTRLSSIDKDSEHRIVCFRDVVVGLDSDKVVMGDDLKSFLRGRIGILKKNGVKDRATLSQCAFDSQVDPDESVIDIEEEEEDEDPTNAENSLNLDPFDTSTSSPSPPIPSPSSESPTAAETETTPNDDDDDTSDLSKWFGFAGSGNRGSRKRVFHSSNEDDVAVVEKTVAECLRKKKYSSYNLRQFAQLVLYKHGLIAAPKFEGERPIKATLISRTANRLITNEAEMKEAIEEKYKDVEVNIVQLEKYTFHEQVEIIRNTHILMGIHGAAFVHLLWLDPTQSAVIEMFPYMVKKQTYEILAYLLNLSRYHWRNNDLSRAKLHWEEVAAYKLTEAEKEKLVTTGRVRDWRGMKCRTFFKMGDTVVDMDKFLPLFDAVYTDVRAKLGSTIDDVDEDA